MTKAEFLGRLTKELKRNNRSDTTDIVEEYEQHFAFKTADGFTEEEVAAKLGDPAVLAAQFGAETEEMGRKTHRAAAIAGLSFTGIAAGLFFVLLGAWGIVFAAFSLCSMAAAIGLVTGLRPWLLLPSMPFGSALLFGLATAALSILTATGCVYFTAFTRQLFRVYGRFHHNTMAAATGKPALPSVPVSPCFSPKVRRRLRYTALAALSAFAALFILGIFVSMLCAGTWEFWHAWGWFGYTA